MEKLRVAIFVSGYGSNMVELLSASQKSSYPAKIKLVICDNPNAPALKKTEKYNVDTKLVNYHSYKNKNSFEKEVLRLLLLKNIEFICLAGFMRILSHDFISKWNGNIINIHPSLLPQYPGLNTHSRVLSDKSKITGCTVHFVSSRIDEGPIIAQSKVQILDCDNVASLSERVLKEEHLLYKEVLKSIAQKKHLLNKR